MATPIKLEAIQYKDKPTGKLREKKAIRSGIIHNIMVWLPCCRGSVDGVIVIFCWTQVETKTKMGIKINDPGLAAKSIPTNSAFNGAAAWTEKNGTQEYSFSEKPTN